MPEEQTQQRGKAASGRAASGITGSAGQRWFVHVNGQTYGPYSAPEIKAMVGKGQVLEADFICIEGGSAWTEARNEPAFSALFKPDAPAPAQWSTLMDDVSAAAQTTDHAPAPKQNRLGSHPLFQRANQDQIREDLRIFFGPRADKYLAIYEKMRSGNKTFVRAMNWTVFLTTFPWYFYRKMYITGALIIFLPPLASYLFGFTGNVGIAVGLGSTANRQYVLSGMKRVQKADALGLAGEERQEYLRRAGGVSVLAGVLASLLLAVAFAALLLGAYLKHRKSVP
jgi:hypothetical protein